MKFQANCSNPLAHHWPLLRIQNGIDENESLHPIALIPDASGTQIVPGRAIMNPGRALARPQPAPAPASH